MHFIFPACLSLWPLLSQALPTSTDDDKPQSQNDTTSTYTCPADRRGPQCCIAVTAYSKYNQLVKPQSQPAYCVSQSVSKSAMIQFVPGEKFRNVRNVTIGIETSSVLPVVSLLMVDDLQHCNHKLDSEEES